ncbi:magnesium-translocating P-type ATPase [Mycolicibacterium madagascariense]|nr:magnesium-translocating P-type ATPase [Mycolicibacterium madagascariense]
MDALQDSAAASEFALFKAADSSPRGLTEEQAVDRLARFGENVSTQDRRQSWPATLLTAVRSPFVFLLGSLGVVFGFLGDARGALTVAVMVVGAGSLRAWQHGRAARAVAALCAPEPATATVRRRSAEDAMPVVREAPVTEIVVGDVVLLQAGDVVPADVRIISATGLSVDQSMLTGETLPVGKAARSADPAPTLAVVAHPRLCFAGTTVVAGSATGLVIGTGWRTYSGSVRRNGIRHDRRSSVDRGVRSVGWTLVRFMLVMAPVVFVVRGIHDGQWSHAAALAVTVAVGLTPEMLPVLVTTTLARGATRFAARDVIVHRLNAIQDLSAMEVLCVDKTGTLTEDRVVYAHGVDACGRPDGLAAELAVAAASCSEITGGRFDDAIAFVSETMVDEPGPQRRLVAEIPFDHRRRRASVVVTSPTGGHQIICQGDADVVVSCCSAMWVDGAAVAIDEARRSEVEGLVADYRGVGMQVLAVAVRDLPRRLERHSDDDEHDLLLAGFVAFVDPVRAGARGTIEELSHLGVALKMITGDARTVAMHTAHQVGIATTAVLVGEDLDDLDDDALQAVAHTTSIFAEVSPSQKARVVAALRRDGTTVGFVGDGVNDVGALRLSDVGIAADTASAATKQAADLIMLDSDLRVIAEGVVEGRRTLGNTMKYVRITASSNFGNALSVIVAGLLLPMLPILPTQLLVQNLLYDCAQLTLPWDRVDADYLRAPRRWRSDGLVGFMIIFGALSSIFDVATFAALWWWFGGAASSGLFRTGWFLEGLLSQLLIVMVLRGRAAPWRSQRPVTVLVLASCLAAAVGLALPSSPLAGVLGMQPLPITYTVWLAVVLVGYAASASWVKRRYVRYVHDYP